MSELPPVSPPDRLSKRAAGIKMSPTIGMAQRASALRAQGKDIISLAVGELDFNTPPYIIEAAHAAAKGGFTRYTAPDGAPVIKAAVIEKYWRENGLFYLPENIHVASGCKQVIYNALAATLDPGDEVILFAPYWVSYSDMVEFCGGCPVVLPTVPGTFEPDLGSLMGAISSRTKWVFINNPCNPTGAQYSDALLRQICKLVHASPGVMILSDEIYEHLLYDGRKHRSLASFSEGSDERVLTVSGVSKTYAMTGWRIGYAGGPTWLINAMARVQSQTAGNSCSISQAAAAAALIGDQSLVAEWRTTLESRRNRSVALLSACKVLDVTVPAGAFYIYVGVERVLGRVTPAGRPLYCDADIAEFLLEEAGVAVVPGVAFGFSPYIRVSFSVSDAEMALACDRIVSSIRLLE